MMSDIMEEEEVLPVVLKPSRSVGSHLADVTKKNILVSRFVRRIKRKSSDYEKIQRIGLPESVKENPNVKIAISGLLVGKKNIETQASIIKRSEELALWLSCGPLGMCNNTYCMTCPPYSHDEKMQRQEKHRREGKHTVHQKDVKPTEWMEKFIFFVHEYIPGVVNPHSKFVQAWEKVFLSSCLIATFVDPLFFFLMSVKTERKCIVFDQRMAWIIVVLRSLTDLLYSFHMLLQFRLAYIKPEHRVVGHGVLVTHPKKIVCNYLTGSFAIDIYAVLPLPQVLIMSVQRNILLTCHNCMGNVLRWVVFFQYLARLYRFLPMLAGRSTTNAFIFETAWAQFVINILCFLLVGHIVGSFWYIFGLQRVKLCLHDACSATYLNLTSTSCKKFIDCGHVSSLLKTPDEWGNNTRANSCFTENGFNYGIYLRAVNLTTEPIVVRYIYSLFWGFQQISTLAGNQNPSYYFWEVVFTMAIVGCGLLLFALLIGSIQNFLQALGKRRMDMMLKRRDVDQWMSHRRFPEEMKTNVRHAEEYNWITNQGVDEEKLLLDLPEDLQTDIRRHLFKFPEKVFSAMSKAVLDSISERLRYKTYITGSQILFSPGQIKKMTFIVRGKMENIKINGDVTQLSAGDVCGEELLIWYLDYSARKKEAKLGVITGGRPVSNRYVTCITNVETFVLGATDLEEVANLFPKSLRNPHVQEAVRYLRYELTYSTDIIAATRIRAAWRKCRGKRLNQYCNTA